jgi:hypothetical protein
LGYSSYPQSQRAKKKKKTQAVTTCFFLGLLSDPEDDGFMFLRNASELLPNYTALRMGADKSLAFPISCFLICSTTKRIFLG